MAGTRRRILALFLPVAAILLVLGEALTPKGLDTPIMTVATALKELPIAAAHSGQLYLSNMLVIFGLGALGVSFSAIGTLARERSALIAISAVMIGGFSAFCGALVNVLIGFNLAAAATAPTTTAAAAQILVSGNTSVASYVLFVGYLGGLLVATILTVIVLWRSKSVPRWLPVLFALGLVAAALSPPGIIAVLLSLPFALAMVMLATRIWATAAALGRDS